MEKKILDGNKLIAEFMEYGQHGLWSFGNTPQERIEIASQTERLQYHTDWSELMPVVEKIESTEINGLKFNCVIGFKNYCAIMGSKGKMGGVVRFESSERYIIEHSPNNIESGTLQYSKEKIECVWKVVVDFIKWYNQNK